MATDYCVKATALHAIEQGYQVELFADLCRGLSPETSDIAIREMASKGATILKI
ncbi:MAG: isochorismatase family protein [Desulfobacterales bacterium]